MDDRHRAWIGALTGGEVIRARRSYRGGSRELWFVEVSTGGVRRYVLRVERGAGAFAGTPLTLAREGAVYRALASSPVPVPGLVGVSTAGDALLLEHLDGDAVVLGEPVSEAVLASFFDAVAALHRLDPRALGLPAAVTGDSELALWGSLADRYLDGGGPLVAYARAWLARNAPRRDAAPVLVQGDTGPGNFLHDGRRVTGLVDFEMAHVGDPMDDIAWIDLRCRDAVGPFGDVALRDEHYRRASGGAIDPGAVGYYAVMVRLRCVVVTGMALARGGGAVGLAPYAAPHHRFVVELGHALADRLGTDTSEHTPTALLGGLIAEPAGDGVIDREVTDRRARLTSTSEPGDRLAVRSDLMMLEHDRVVQRLGGELARLEARDRRSALGRDLTDEALEAVARDAGRRGDTDVLALLIRSACRAGRPWWTEAVGGVTDPPPAPERT